MSGFVGDEARWEDYITCMRRLSDAGFSGTVYTRMKQGRISRSTLEYLHHQVAALDAAHYVTGPLPGGVHG